MATIFSSGNKPNTFNTTHYIDHVSRVLNLVSSLLPPRRTGKLLDQKVDERRYPWTLVLTMRKHGRQWHGFYVVHIGQNGCQPARTDSITDDDIS
jgi:hypothetical protein